MGKLILLIALAVTIVSLPVDSTTITTINGVINCDGIKCPKGSTSCYVSKKSSSDLKSCKYIRMCTDANGVLTHKVEEEIPNPPGTYIDSVSSTGGTNRPLTEQEKKELDATIAKTIEQSNKIIEEQNQYWDQWTRNFNSNLQNMFPPGFPFN